MTPRSRLAQTAALSACGFVFFFGTWWGVAASGWLPRNVLPAPPDVAATFIALLREPFAGYTFQQHLGASIGRYLMGFALAALVGIPLGLLMGWYRLLDAIVTPLFEGVRFIAPLAWVPFAALWFGTGIGGPIMIIFSGAFPPCVVSAYRGAKLVDARLVEAAQTLGASSTRIIVEVLVPGALPSIISGLRVAAGLGWQSLVGAELIVVSAGVGYLMVQGQSNLATAVVVCGMIGIGAVGFAIDVALRALERRIKAQWSPA